MKHIITIVISSFLLACNGKAQTNKNTSNKAKDTPEVNKMLEAYHKQKHRLAFNGCEMSYNEKPFKLGMSVKEIKKIFGDYETTDLGAIIYRNQGVVFATSEKNISLSSVIDIVYIYMNTTVSEDYKEKLKHKLNHKKDYFLIEGMPVDKNTQVMDFITNSEFDLNDFGVSNDGYELDYDCNEKKIGYRLEADGLWLRKGTGHLTYKDKPNPKNENPFEMLYITEIEE